MGLTFFNELPHLCKPQNISLPTTQQQRQSRGSSGSYDGYGFGYFSNLWLQAIKRFKKNGSKIVKSCSNISSDSKTYTSQIGTEKRCLRCNNLYTDEDNSPTACSFHGHSTGEKGLFALAPPHQGIDGEWSDRSGVIVYRWNEKNKRPNTGSGNWKKRWSCCQEYDQDATPCQRGWHVSYDDGFTLY